MNELGDYPQAWARTALAELGDVLPDAARQAAAALTAALEPVDCSSWPEVAWSASRLAGGMPVELVWRPGQSLLGWTCEAAGPETPEEIGVAQAVESLRRMGQPCPPPNNLNVILRAQQGRTLDWGAWLGGRHGPSGAAYKIYGSLPAGSEFSLPGLAEPIADWLAEQNKLLLGVAQDGTIEVYGRCGPAGLGGLPLLLDLREPYRKLSQWAAGILDTFDVMERLEGLGAGWSLAFGPDGGCRAVALFFKPSFYAINGERLCKVLDRLVTGNALDAAWRRLLTSGLCAPGFLGLAASGAGLRSQISIVRPQH